MLKPLTKIALILSVLSLTGCASPRTVILNSQSDVVRLGPDVRGHVYYKRNGQWELSPDKVTLPEGWLAGPPR